MAFKRVLTLAQILLVSTLAQAAHVTDRKVQASDIVRPDGTSVLKLPSTAPVAGKVAVFNSDGELTDGPMNGSYLDATSSIQTQLNSKAGLTSNTFSGTQTIQKSALGTTTTDGVVIENTTNAAAGAQQISPSLRLRGRGWKTNTTAGSQPVDWNFDVLPVQGSASPSSNLRIRSATNGGAFVDALEIQNSILGTSIPRIKTYGVLDVNVDGNNATLGTIDHISLRNPTGSRIHQSNYFGSTIKNGWTYESNGTIRAWMLNNSVFEFDFASSLPGGLTYYTQIYPGGVYTGGGVYASSSGTFGNSNTTPNATLSTYGSFAVKGVEKTSDFTVDNTATMFYCDGSSSSGCTGTPSSACSSYTNSTTCNAKNTLGCSWSGGSCSEYTDPSGCAAAPGGSCTWTYDDCSIYNSDETSCLSNSCSFSYNDCSSFDESTCNSTSGCSVNPLNCSDSFFDETSCNAQGGCSWNGSSCDGSYGFASCSGSYTTCSGSLPTGTCSGTYGSCGGTASCGNMTASGESACNAISGCAWTTGMTATLPSIETHLISGGGTTGFRVGIKNIGTTGNVTVKIPDGVSDTFEDGTTTKTLAPVGAATPKPYLELHPLKKTATCSAFDNNLSSCNLHSGCSFVSVSCSSFGEMDCPTGDGCSWNGSTCDGTYSGSLGSCTGTYSVYKKWFFWGSE